MGHSHDHGHSLGPESAHRRVWPMGIAAGLIGSFFVIELVVGFVIGSLALVADAGHMATDLVALVMGLGALLLARHSSSEGDKTFGWHRAEVFTAVINAVLLVAVAVFVLVEAVDRVGDHPHVPGLPMVIVALVGLAVNVAVMMVLRVDAEGSIAIRGAYMEVVADAVGSVGVLIAGVVTMTTSWPYADLVVAILIAVWVAPRAGRLAIDALRILAQRAPTHIDIDMLRDRLAAIPGVTDVHDLHVWTLTTGMDVATVHLGAVRDNAEVLADAREILEQAGLPHATVQIESTEEQRRCHRDLTW